jgi:hypothetical protein
MAELRCEITGDVHEVGRNARVMTDWTFYVRRFPWAMVTIAAVVGFMLVPRKKAIISPDQEALADMVRKKQLRLDVDHKVEKQGMLKSLLTMAAAWAVKTAMAYTGERIRTAAVSKAQERPSAAPAAVPLHEPLTY